MDDRDQYHDNDGQPTHGSPHPEFVTDYQTHEHGSNGGAVAALVLGILALVTGCGIILGPIAIVIGNNAVVAAREGRAPASSAGLATAGKICGIVATCLGGLVLLFYLLIMVIGLAGGGFGP